MPTMPTMTAGDWTVLGILLASWLLYFAVHSLLASLRLKAWAAAHVPAVMPWFRLIYNLIAVLGLLPIFYLLLFCPTPIVWAWHGFAAWLANALALAALFGVWTTLSHYDSGEFFGFNQWRSRRQDIADREAFHLSPFHRHVRHPWYFCSLILIWTRDMNAAMLLSAVLASVYFIVGSHLEEKKLLVFHGDVYRCYMEKVPGLLPWPGKSLTAAAAEQLGRGDEPAQE